MSQEQALQDTGSSAQEDPHSDDADLYSDDALPKPAIIQDASFTAQRTIGASDQQDLYSDGAPSTPVTVKAISPEPGGSPSSLDLDSTLERSSGRKTDGSVQTGRDSHPHSSSEKEAQGPQDDDVIESIERDDIGRPKIDDKSNDSIEEDVEELEYTQPPPTIIPKTRFVEVFFAPQGDPALIPPVPGRESQYSATPAPISELAMTDPRPVPRDLYWKILGSGYAELPVGPGMDGFYPSARDLVAMTRHLHRTTVACMAERIQKYQKTVVEKNSVIEELEKTLADPDAAAQSTEIGTLKGSNKYLEDRIYTITNHYDHGKAKYASELEELQADVRTANEDQQRAKARFTTYETQITAKNKIIEELRAVSKGAAPDSTIVSPTDESDITSRVKSIQILQQIIAGQQATITQQQNDAIEYRTKDMTKTEADSADRALRAEYARDKLKDEIKVLEAEVDEQKATIALYEERLQDQEAQIQRLQLEKAQHAQDIRAAERRITEFTSRELTLTKDKTSLTNRAKALNEELKDRSKELKESDEQLIVVRRGHAVTLAESARLKDEIQKVTHERTMLQRSLAQAGDWRQEKYTTNLTSEELKQKLAALREDTARMTDRHRFQIENLEVTTREKIKNERKEATRKRRKVQEELVALRGRALTNPSEADSEQDQDSASAVNRGQSLEEELYGFAGSYESSPIEEAADVATNGGNSIQASPAGTQDHPPQNNPPHLFKHSEHKNTPQSEEDTISSAEDEKPKRVGRIRSRRVTSLGRPRDIEISRAGELIIDGAVQPEGDSTVSQQSISNFDNETQQERESMAYQQRLPIFEAPLRPEEGFKALQQRPPTLNEQALHEADFSTRRQRPPILNTHVPSGIKQRKLSPTRLDFDGQERPMAAPGALSGTDFVRSLRDGANNPPLASNPITASDSNPSQRPSQHADRYLDKRTQPITNPGALFGTDFVRSLRNGANSPPPISNPITASGSDPSQRPSQHAVEVQIGTNPNPPQEQYETADRYLDERNPPITTHSGKLYGTDFVRNLIPPQEQPEAAAPSGPPVPPSDEAGTETNPPQEPEQAGDGDPQPPSNPSSGPPSPSSGRGGGGLRGRRTRAPVIIPVYERVPYRQGPWFGHWEGLAWALVLLSVLATFLMFMALQVERHRWLAANEGTRQMLFSVKRRGPVGTGLLTWIFNNAFLNVETNSYG
ncbi:hypothetical protein MMC17_002231 [Xylographa soralifera]|nr:hypothetical protein [Xylographa soralifera]